MIHHVWTVFCTSSAIDRDTNTVSLFDIVEQIDGEIPEAIENKKIIIPAKFQLFTLWARGASNEGEIGTTRTRFLAPNGDVLLTSQNEVDLRESIERRRVRLNIAGLPYTGRGCYRFVVEIQSPDGQWVVGGNVPVPLNIHGPVVPATDDVEEPMTLP